MEARAKGNTSEAIRRLVRLQAKTARVRKDGAVQEVDIAAVRAGDTIEVRPGERIPVDGEVIEGSSFVDESMIDLFLRVRRLTSACKSQCSPLTSTP